MHELSTAAICLSTAISPSAGPSFLLSTLPHVAALPKCERSWWKPNVIISVVVLGWWQDLYMVQRTTRSLFKWRTFASFQGQLFQPSVTPPPFPLNVNGMKLDWCRSYPTISNSYCYCFPLPYINIALLQIFHHIEQNNSMGHLLYVIPRPSVSHHFYVSVKWSSKEKKFKDILFMQWGNNPAKLSSPSSVLDQV